jgi:HAE1 family hydrophobic/amphiphilic exporter-1
MGSEMKYMTSDAGNDGEASIPNFNLGTDRNQAAINISEESLSFCYPINYPPLVKVREG